MGLTEVTNDDCISRKAAIDAILAVTGNSSVRELYEHVQEHGLSDMWSGGVNAAIDIIIAVPSAQPEPCVDTISRKAAVDLFPDDDLECDTKGGYIAPHLARRMICELPSAQPHTNSWYINSWCIDCKEYDTENKCCPRYNRVIKQTLDDAYRHGETEAEARYHAQQRWIPCSERLPSEGENVLLCDTRFGKVAIGKLIRYNTSCCWEVDHWDCDIEDWQAWMPLPEPYKDGE